MPAPEHSDQLEESIGNSTAVVNQYFVSGNKSDAITGSERDQDLVVAQDISSKKDEVSRNARTMVSASEILDLEQLEKSIEKSIAALNQNFVSGNNSDAITGSEHDQDLVVAQEISSKNDEPPSSARTTVYLRNVTAKASVLNNLKGKKIILKRVSSGLRPLLPKKQNIQTLLDRSKFTRRIPLNPFATFSFPDKSLIQTNKLRLEKSEETINIPQHCIPVQTVQSTEAALPRSIDATTLNKEKSPTLTFTLFNDSLGKYGPSSSILKAVDKDVKRQTVSPASKINKTPILLRNKKHTKKVFQGSNQYNSTNNNFRKYFTIVSANGVRKSILKPDLGINKKSESDNSGRFIVRQYHFDEPENTSQKEEPMVINIYEPPTKTFKNKIALSNFGNTKYSEKTQSTSNMKHINAQENEQIGQELHCVQCGCYGHSADFVDNNICSLDCQNAGKETKVKKQRKPRSPSKKASTPKSDNDVKGSSAQDVTSIDTSREAYLYPWESPKKASTPKSDNDIEGSSAQDVTSIDTSREAFLYPWESPNNGFSWPNYLLHTQATAAPFKLFRNNFPITRNEFEIGMKLEGFDPKHPSYICVLTIADVVGYRIRLHFDGYSENYDFWINADSPDIFPIGWCEQNGRRLRLPPRYTVENFNWRKYLKVMDGKAAPRHLFTYDKVKSTCLFGFRIGMKLEASDKTDSSQICVATIKDILYGRILVHFDGWGDIYDYWASPSSPFLHPVGWCDETGHDLAIPGDYPTPDNFTWKKYLKETGALTAPTRAFGRTPKCRFEKGMKLECVDKRVPHLIRVATIEDVKDHRIKILLDGWPYKYSYWMDYDSPDIHPAGWCQRTGHPLEPPSTPRDVYTLSQCPTVLCSGQGHSEGLKYRTHSSKEFCPYADENLDIDKIMPDRLLGPDESLDEEEPVLLQPLNGRKRKMPPKGRKYIKASEKNTDGYKPPAKKMRLHTPPQLRDDVNKPNPTGTPTLAREANSILRVMDVTPAEKETWKKHSQFLEEILPDKTPLSWSTDDVIRFVSSIPDCDIYVGVLKEHEIDGPALLLLTMTDIIDMLNFKFGPAVKLFNSILLLREQMSYVEA